MDLLGSPSGAGTVRLNDVQPSQTGSHLQTGTHREYISHLHTFSHPLDVAAGGTSKMGLPEHIETRLFINGEVDLY